MKLQPNIWTDLLAALGLILIFVALMLVTG